MRSCPHCLSPYSAKVDFCGMDGFRLHTGGDDALVGQSIDRYQIIEVLGEGAMARVYRARHTTLEIEYAIKVLYGEMAADKQLAERFRREAQATSRIQHPNVVGVKDFGSTDRGLTFMAMELLRGQTLRQRIKQEQRLSPERAIEITLQVARGLQEAHRHNFVHRDLKPGNIMLCPDTQGRDLVKILDFGLVRVCDLNDEPELTKTGQFLGTPIYMAPEQMLGLDVGVPADLYALGIMLFEMIEGHPPFRAKNLSLIREQHLKMAPPAVDSAKSLEPLIHALLAKEPEHRPKSAAEVIERLEALPPVTSLGSVVPTNVDKPPPISPVLSAQIALTPSTHNSRPHPGAIFYDSRPRNEPITPEKRSSPAVLFVTSAARSIALSEDKISAWRWPSVAAVLVGTILGLWFLLGSDRGPQNTVEAKPLKLTAQSTLTPLPRKTEATTLTTHLETPIVVRSVETTGPRAVLQDNGKAPAPIEVAPFVVQRRKNSPAHAPSRPRHRQTIAPKVPAETANKDIAERTLNKMYQRLTRAAAHMPQEELLAFEDRYLVLLQALGAADSPEAYRRVIANSQQIMAELARKSKPNQR